jgi:hypothetical protein
MFSLKMKEKKTVRPLTESDIRNRLYGSAVGVSADNYDEPSRRKRSPEKTSPAPIKDSSGDDILKIHNELASLRLELQQAKQRLEKVKGADAKKLPAIFLYVIIFIVLVFAIHIIRSIAFSKPQAKPAAHASASVSNTRYTVQVAVSERLSDAEKFKENLADKGYKVFIKKTNSASGRDRFIIYAGEFNNKESAASLMNALHLKEGITDSFVSNMPE